MGLEVQEGGGWQVEEGKKGEKGDMGGGSCHGSEPHEGQKKQQETRRLIAGEYVSIAPPNLARWLINKSSGLCVFYKGLLGLKL